MKLNKYVDHTLLKAVAMPLDIEKLCKEAKEYDFASVCINSCYVKKCYEILKETNVKVCAVIGFPLGAMSTESKIFEAKNCIENGAKEVDMVINVGMLKAKEYKYIEEEIRRIKESIGNNILKVIIETCYLTNDEKVKVCELSMKAKADFVKTSTGFGTGGATFEDVSLMKKTVKDVCKVKAAGGVRDIKTALKYIEIGADRLGTSSGIKLVKGE